MKWITHMNYAYLYLRSPWPEKLKSPLVFLGQVGEDLRFGSVHSFRYHLCQGVENQTLTSFTAIPGL